jgi:uncharacterized membrane protein
MDRQDSIETQRDLRPAANRGTWVAWGLALQAIGVGIPVTAALRQANQDGLLGNITHYSIRLLWRELSSSDADVALVVLGVVLFVAGAVVLARPFVRRRSNLFVTVPVVAVFGIAVLGVIALVCAAVIAVFESPGDSSALRELFNNIPWPLGSRRRRR